MTNILATYQPDRGILSDR